MTMDNGQWTAAQAPQLQATSGLEAEGRRQRADGRTLGEGRRTQAEELGKRVNG